MTSHQLNITLLSILWRESISTQHYHKFQVDGLRIASFSFRFERLILVEARFSGKISPLYCLSFKHAYYRTDIF